MGPSEGEQDWHWFRGSWFISQTWMLWNTISTSIRNEDTRSTSRIIMANEDCVGWYNGTQIHQAEEPGSSSSSRRKDEIGTRSNEKMSLRCEWRWRGGTDLSYPKLQTPCTSQRHPHYLEDLDSSTSSTSMVDLRSSDIEGKHSQVLEVSSFFPGFLVPYGLLCQPSIVRYIIAGRPTISRPIVPNKDSNKEKQFKLRSVLNSQKLEVLAQKS